MELEGTDPAPALTIVASVAHTAPAAWFSDPGFTPDDPRLVQAKDGTWGCPVTVTDEGEVYGHIAKWGVCHIAYSGECVTAPHSQTNYAHFLGGAVHLDDGTVACTGPITVGGGHADEHMSMQMAKAYYDSTSTVAADVAAGDDQFGIWCHGWIRPGTSKDMATALRASVLSGDWRQPSPGSPLQELIVAHAVNAGGFSTPRVRIAAGSQGQISLVAAGAVPQREEHKVSGRGPGPAGGLARRRGHRRARGACRAPGGDGRAGDQTFQWKDRRLMHGCNCGKQATTTWSYTSAGRVDDHQPVRGAGPRHEDPRRRQGAGAAEVGQTAGGPRFGPGSTTRFWTTCTCGFGT